MRSLGHGVLCDFTHAIDGTSFSVFSFTTSEKGEGASHKKILAA